MLQESQQDIAMMFYLERLSVVNAEQITEESQEKMQRLFGDAQIELNMGIVYAKNQLLYLTI